MKHKIRLMYIVSTYLFAYLYLYTFVQINIFTTYSNICLLPKIKDWKQNLYDQIFSLALNRLAGFNFFIFVLYKPVKRHAGWAQQQSVGD